MAVGSRGWTVHKMGRLTAAALTGLPAALGLVAAVALANGVGQEQRQQDSRHLLAQAVQACHEADAGVDCVQQAVGTSIERIGVPGTARDLVRILGSDESFGGVCHEAMHWLGRQAAPEYREHVEELREVFPACAFGLMHGIIESVPLPPDPQAAASEIRELCAQLTGWSGKVELGSKEHYLLSDCAHGTGHSLGYSHPGKLSYGFQSCRNSFDLEDVLWACFNGVGMVNVGYAAEALAARDPGTEVTVDTWEELTEPICGLMEELRDRACPGAFVQVAADSGVAAEVGFLNWCQEKYPDTAYLCFQGLGTAMGVSARALEWPVERVGDEMLTVCAVADNSDLLVECWAALSIGLTQRGIGNESAAKQACAEFQGRLETDLAERACSRARDLTVGSGAVLEATFQ